CASQKSAEAWSGFGAALAADPSKVGLGYLSKSDVQVVGMYHGILSAGSEAAAVAYVKANKDGLTDDQFRPVVQILRQRLADDYDMQRAEGGPHSTGIVTGDQLLAAAATNTEFGSASNVAGVCRDIATFQAKLLEARGLPNSFVLSYGLPGSFHSIAIS